MDALLQEFTGPMSRVIDIDNQEKESEIRIKFNK